ncbi:hypothetical protein [Solidesulfovibrio sp.]
MIKFGDESDICCPHCGDSMDMHHVQVEVFTRKEDSDRGDYVKARQDTSQLSTSVIHPPGNPSSRRSGIAIEFECFACGKHSRLGIAQHKGQTFFSWE